MPAQPKPLLTPEQYIAIEREANHKSEYYAGEMFAMAGGTRRHNLIASNIIRHLGNQLKKRPCLVYNSDQRVRIEASGLFTYPDVTIVCGEEEVWASDSETLLNPTLIVEVLSKSTEGYDRGQKFEHYRTLPSLQTYVLVSQDQARIERFERQAEAHWLFTEAIGLDATLTLPSLDAELALAEVYDKVTLPPDVPEASTNGAKASE